MRDASARAEEALDDVSANLAEVLRRADALLAEWSAFGAAVRAQVEREAATVGDAVAAAVDGAVGRSIGASLERAVPEQLGARMAGLTAELAKLEHRARSAAKSISDDRVHDRRLLGGLVLGVLVANALLVLLLLRSPHTRAPSPEATRLVEPVLAPAPRAAPIAAESPIDAAPASTAGDVPPTQGSGATPALARDPGTTQDPEAPRTLAPNSAPPAPHPAGTGSAAAAPHASGAPAPRGAATRSSLPARKR